MEGSELFAMLSTVEREEHEESNAISISPRPVREITCMLLWVHNLHIFMMLVFKQVQVFDQMH